MINKSVSVDIEQYKQAIEFVINNNPAMRDEDEVREILDKLIKDTFISGDMCSTIGCTVYCSDYSEDKNSAYCTVLVDPSLGKDTYYIQMAI